MTIPVNITVRHIEKTPFIEEDILQKAQKMAQFHDRIESLKVVVDVQQNKHHKGKLYNVMIEGLVPGKRIVVNHNPNENLYVAIRDAFDALRTQLKDHSRQIKGDVKTHQERLMGKVTRLFSGYGFIETASGNEYYFHESVVANGGFESLAEGTLVTFIEATAGETLQAAHVIKAHNGVKAA